MIKEGGRKGVKVVRIVRRCVAVAVAAAAAAADAIIPLHDACEITGVKSYTFAGLQQGPIHGTGWRPGYIGARMRLNHQAFCLIWKSLRIQCAGRPRMMRTPK